VHSIFHPKARSKAIGFVKTVYKRYKSSHPSRAHSHMYNMRHGTLVHCATVPIKRQPMQPHHAETQRKREKQTLQATWTPRTLLCMVSLIGKEEDSFLWLQTPDADAGTLSRNEIIAGLGESSHLLAGGLIVRNPRCTTDRETFRREDPEFEYLPP
jgi:hypothetical protein